MRERLMSGQRWYFDEDGTSVTLDLVVDVLDPRECNQTSHVMIGGLWYKEEIIQHMVSGRRNSVYTVVDDKLWSYDRLCSDIKTINSVVEKEMSRYQPWELDNAGILQDIIAAVKKALLSDPYNTAVETADGLVMSKGVALCLPEIVKNYRDIRKTAKFW